MAEHTTPPNELERRRELMISRLSEIESVANTIQRSTALFDSEKAEKALDDFLDNLHDIFSTGKAWARNARYLEDLDGEVFTSMQALKVGLLDINMVISRKRPIELRSYLTSDHDLRTKLEIAREIPGQVKPSETPVSSDKQSSRPWLAGAFERAKQISEGIRDTEHLWKAILWIGGTIAAGLAALGITTGKIQALYLHGLETLREIIEMIKAALNSS